MNRNVVNSIFTLILSMLFVTPDVFSNLIFSQLPEIGNSDSPQDLDTAF